MTKFLLPIAINVINKAVDKIPEDLDDLLKKFVVSLLKKAAAKTGNVKSRGKRKAGQVFGYVSVPKRVVTGKAELGEFGKIIPDFTLPSRRD